MSTPFVLNFEFDGETQVLSALSRFGEFVDDMDEVYDDIVKDFTRVEDERFEASGPGWAPLSPRYRAWKTRHYPGRPLLVREGDLRASLTGGRGFIHRREPHGVTVGSAVPYARFHHRGTRDMPARRLVEVDSATRTRWAKMVQRYLVKRAREVGLK